MSASDRYRIDSLKAELEQVKAERDRYQEGLLSVMNVGDLAAVKVAGAALGRREGDPDAEVQP